MADIINKFYKKIANNGNDNDYELVGEIGVNGMPLEEYLNQRFQSILGEMYPVGSIYLSVKNENPSTKFGGTWVAWGSGRVPVGVNSSDSSFNSVEKTGGSKTHNHTITVNNKAAFTSGSTALSKAQIPNVFGSITMHGGSEGSNIYTVSGCFNASKTTSGYRTCTSVIGGATSVGVIDFNNGGGGGGHTHSIPAHNHTASSNSPTALPPYITCYMWKRTK